MIFKTKNPFVGAAVSGMVGAAAMMISQAPARATDGAAKKDAAKSTQAPAKDDKTPGQCLGANACKGQSKCHTAGKNECAGQNECKGKGWLETTKAECEKAKKTHPKAQFQADAKSS